MVIEWKENDSVYTHQIRFLLEKLVTYLGILEEGQKSGSIHFMLLARSAQSIFDDA